MIAAVPRVMSSGFPERDDLPSAKIEDDDLPSAKI